MHDTREIKKYVSVTFFPSLKQNFIAYRSSKVSDCIFETDARFMQDAPKAVRSTPYVVSVTFFPSLKQNFIAYRSSKVSDCIFETDARFMQDAPKAVRSTPYVVSVAFCQSLKHNFIAYRSPKVSWRPDFIFEIHQQWQSGFSRVYSRCCCSCSFESEIIKIGQSSHKMYSNNIVNFQESTTILNVCTKKAGNLLNAPHIVSISITFSFHTF